MKPDLFNGSIKPFPYYVQKVFPAVYDDSLSYYELLSKVMAHLNEMGQTTNALIDLWNEVVEWIVNDGLNEAVCDRLDQYVLDGTLERIINKELFASLHNNVFYLSHYPRLNGESDDTQRFERVIGDANTNATIILDEHEYLISDTVVIPEGKNNLVFKTVSNYYGSIIKGETSNMTMFRNLAYGTTFERIMFMGDGGSYGEGATITGLINGDNTSIKNCDAFFIECTFIYLKLGVDIQCVNTMIDNHNTFSNSVTGVRINLYTGDTSLRRSVMIKNNRFHECQVAITSVNSSNEVVISNNIIDFCLGGIECQLDNALITDNLIGHLKGFGMKITGNTGEGVIIDGNTIKGSTTDENTGNGIEILANGVNLGSNTVSGVGGHGVYVNAAYVQITSLVVINANYFDVKSECDNNQKYHGVFFDSGSYRCSALNILSRTTTGGASKQGYGVLNGGSENFFFNVTANGNVLGDYVDRGSLTSGYLTKQANRDFYQNTIPEHSTFTSGDRMWVNNTDRYIGLVQNGGAWKPFGLIEPIKTSKDFTFMNNNTGIIMQTPDALKHYKITVSNTGEVVTTEVQV